MDGEDVINTHTHIHTLTQWNNYSAIKEGWNKLFAASQMDLEIITLNDMSERQLPNGITYMWNLKYDTEKQPHRHGKETYG